MSEVRLPAPVPAQHIADLGALRARKVAGSFHLEPPDEDQEQWFWYVCPCGCGQIGPINVGNGFKPENRPSWTWDGSLEAPTLTPSIHHRGHWHGWLRAGVWTQA